MKYFNITGLALAATLGFAGMAQAAVIYNNGGPNSVGGNEATQRVQAEDFSFDTDVTVTGAGVYIAGLGGIADWDNTVNYWIFSDNAGPAGVLASGSGQNLSTTDTGSAWCCGGNAYLVEFDFVSDFAATGGATYWLGIHLASDFEEAEYIYWVTTAGNGTATGEGSLGGTFDNWFENDEHAFFLNGSREPGEVPAPAGMALMGLGLVALGATRRRKA